MKFWQVWRADEIVAVYKDGDNVTVKLRNGEIGRAYGTTTAQAIQEIEAVLTDCDCVEQQKRLAQMGLDAIEFNRDRLLKEIERIKAIPFVADLPSKQIYAILRPLINKERKYIKSDELADIVALLMEEVSE